MPARPMACEIETRRPAAPQTLALQSPMPTADPNYSRRWLIFAVVGVAQAMMVLDTKHRMELRR